MIKIVLINLFLHHLNNLNLINLLNYINFNNLHFKNLSKKKLNDLNFKLFESINKYLILNNLILIYLNLKIKFQKSQN